MTEGPDTKRLHLTVSKQQAEFLLREALAAGLSISTFVRAALANSAPGFAAIKEVPQSYRCTRSGQYRKPGHQLNTATAAARALAELRGQR